MRDIADRGGRQGGRGGLRGVKTLWSGEAGWVSRRVLRVNQSLPEFLISLASTLIFTVATT